MFSLQYEICCLALTRSELDSLARVLDSMASDFGSGHGDPEQKLLIRNTRWNMALNLTVRQVGELRSLIQEAMCLFEVYSLIYDEQSC